MALEVRVGVDGRAGHADFVVEMRGGGAACLTGPGDDLAASDALAGEDIEVGEVAVVGFHSIAMVDDEKATIAGVDVGEFDLAAGSGNHRGPDGDGDVDAGVEAAMAIERIEALAVEAGEAALDRPEAGLIFEEIARTNRAGSVERVAEGGGESGVAEEVIVFDGIVEGGGELGFDAEGLFGFEFAFDSVGDSDFAGEDLEGGELLFAGVVFLLESQVAFADGINLLAQRVVIIDLPEHSGVGSGDTGEANGTEQGECQDAVQDTVRDVNTPKAAVQRMRDYENEIWLRHLKTKSRSEQRPLR